MAIKVRITYFYCNFWPLLAYKINPRGQIVMRFSEQSYSPPPEHFSSIGPASLAVYFKVAMKIVNPRIAISRSKIFFSYFCGQNSELHDICSISKNVHPPFKTEGVVKAWSDLRRNR